MFLKILITTMVGVFMLCGSPVIYAQSGTNAQGETVSMSEEGIVSIDFRDADIRNVLEILAFKSGVNIVASPDVVGTISIQLNEVPWQQALDVIVRTYGYAYEKKGNIILVTTVEDLKQKREDAILLAEQEPLQTETFILNFSKASEVVVSIEKMKSERGNVDFDERTNTIIVTDTSDRMELMTNVIKTLDRTTPQVLIETKIVETTFSNTENMGIDWITRATIGGSMRPITWPFSPDGSSDNQVASAPFPGTDPDLTTANTHFTYGTLDFAQVQAVFELLRSKVDTNILSNPRIVTVDNKPAQIVVGSQYPIPSYVYNEDQARLQVNGFEYKDIGIIFDVTPHVNSAGYVSMEIKPQITAILDFVTVENTSLPQLSNESANTNVIVKDGDTLVIAGLVKDQTTETRKKTPFLGDIPIVGLVFTKKESTITKTDLIIFITPHIITPDID